MNDVAYNEPWLDERAREVRASIAAIQGMSAQFSYLQLGWRPPDGGWSIGQVFEHLILTDRPYIDAIRRALRNAPRARDAWRSSFLGGMLVRAVSPEAKRKAKAFKGYRPGPQPRADVVSDYLALREQLLELIAEARGADLRRTRFHSRIFGLIRLNLGDGIMVMIRHTERHLQQVARVHQQMISSGPANVI